MRNLYLSVGLSLVIVACASEPTEEIQQAEAAMSKAQGAEASRWAPEANQKAEEKLAEAKRLVQQGDYSEAVPALAEAKRLAAAATQEAVDGKRKAQEEQKRAEAERKKAEAELAAKRNSHTVVKGECLWYIAGYDDVYGDPYQWTRIYHANKDQIRDPDLIYPDQVFQIPR
ncbi:MAG: LysM peptidoglycan-binding domain-containing protein [Acidobacteriota bacterium]